MAELREITSLNNSLHLPKENIIDKGNSARFGLDNKAFKETDKEMTSAADSQMQTTTGESNLQDNGSEDDNSSNCIESFQRAIVHFLELHGELLRMFLCSALLLAYYAYFGYAVYYSFGDEGSWRLVICTGIASLGLAVHLFRGYIKDKRQLRLDEITMDTESRNTGFNVLVHFEKIAAKIRLALFLPVLLLIAFIIFLIVEVGLQDRRNLVSLAGLCFFLLAMFVFSKHPSQVNWRPVFWGVALEIIFAMLILKTHWGYETFKWLGDRITEFLANSDQGAAFVFGEVFKLNSFAFRVLPVVIFFSTFVAVLYHLGAMQAVILRLGRFLAWCLGTSQAESINAAGNIFLGQTEAPIMIRPFLADMTHSELHAVMTGGFATIAGAVMALYISYDVPANHLLSASVMSAPAALAISKLFWPETGSPKTNAQEATHLAKGQDHNLVEAASNGASMSVKLVANIAVNLIAFVALLQFINSTLTWFGDRAGIDELTFQVVCSYVFWPLAFLMGVDSKDCRAVAELLGIKTFLNELVAYLTLSTYIENRKILDEYLYNATQNTTGNLTGLWEERGGDIYLFDTKVTLSEGIISDRSMVIATYALCGFSNLSSIGIQLGGLGALAPSRKSEMSRIVVRAMIAGNVVCFMNACIAGLFYDGDG